MSIVINTMTSLSINDAFLLPRREALQEAQLFTTLYLASGYWKVEIFKDDRIFSLFE